MPIAYQGTGKVAAVRCLRTDEHKKPIAGTEYDLPADVVFLATGQSKLGQMLSALEGVELKNGRVIVGKGGALARKKWFAGGDAANGGKEVVNGVAEGRDAARAIHAMFSGGAA